MGGTLVEHRLFQREQAHKGLIIEYQPLGPVEDRHRLGHVVERLVVSLTEAFERRARLFGLGDVHGETGRAPADRIDMKGHDAPLAAGHGAAHAQARRPGAQRIQRLLGQGRLQQHLLIHRVGGALRLDGAGIGLIDPDQASGGVHAPGRGRVARRHVVTGGGIGIHQLAGFRHPPCRAGVLHLADGRIGQPHRQLAARRASVDFQRASRRTGDGQRKGLSGVHQAAQALAQRGGVAARAARFEIGDAVKNLAPGVPRWPPRPDPDRRTGPWRRALRASRKCPAGPSLWNRDQAGFPRRG